MYASRCQYLLALDYISSMPSSREVLKRLLSRKPATRISLYITGGKVHIRPRPGWRRPSFLGLRHPSRSKDAL
jgi:hypothetical protein